MRNLLLSLGLASFLLGTASAGAATVCGDINASGSLEITDALAILKVAVGAGSCSPLVCDVNDDGDISPTDALLVLKKSIGVAVTLRCPPPPTVPAAPGGLKATPISTSRIDLAWTDNSGIEAGFKIERKTGANGTWEQIAAPAANTKVYSNTMLAASTKYFYRVRAFNNDGNSPYSNEAGATTFAVPTGPAAPSHLDAVAETYSAIRLYWDDNSSSEKGFRIERAVGSGSFVQIREVAAGTESVLITNLSSDTTYHFRVRAYHTLNSGYSNEDTARTATPIRHPVGFAGNVSWQTSGNVVDLSADRIENNSSFTRSGSLRMRLWATEDPYLGRSPLVGYVLAVRHFSPLEPLSFYNGIFGFLVLTEPPAGSWYTNITLEEFTGFGWAIRDYVPYAGLKSF